MPEIKPSIGQRLLKAFSMVFSGQRGYQSLSINDGFTTPSYADLTVFPNTRVDYEREAGAATSQSLVMAAVEWTSKVLPEAPIVITETSSDGTETPLPGHPVAQLLRQPNRFTDLADLLACFALDWIASGNVYLLKIRNFRGAVIELEPVPSTSIQPCWPDSGSEFISHYEYRVNNQRIQLPVEDVIHFRNGRDPRNPRVGLSPIASLYRELYSDNEASNFQAALLRNYGVGGLLISPSDSQATFDPADADFIKSEIHRRTVGDERGKPIIAGGPVKIERLSFDPKALDLKSLRRLPEERVAAVLGIPASVLGFGAGLDRNTYSNAEEAREAAYESYIIPLQRRICMTLDTQLLAEFDSTGRMKTSFDLSKVRALQQDETEMVNRLAVAYKAGIIKRSEARSAMGLPVEPEDDSYFIAPTAPDSELVTPSTEDQQTEKSATTHE